MKLSCSALRIVGLVALLCSSSILVAPALSQEGAKAIGYAERTDSVEEKLRLLEQAYREGNLDVALSLAASIRWTVHLEKQTRGPVGQSRMGADLDVEVDQLPAPWGEWARGWKYCRAIVLAETAGIARTSEPVDLGVDFPPRAMADPHREVRVARLASGALRQVVSQIYGETRKGESRSCRLVFLADVPAGGEVTYLIFYGNPNAQRPNYATDLEVTGEAYDLDISNRHFTAHLSSLTGQLERIVYKRQHGLELYAGGKGHGEPPTIDWSNDYVDEGHFQKLRIRAWPEVPNWEVVRGPLCVRVRRWGFPASPLHPVYAPSRMHIDQTYTFYAGADYFLKEGEMQAIKDLAIAAMRDDEWVLSGYSFTDLVWIDADGKLHEGSVPGQHANNLWGVGFFHRASRDAFIALRLEHAADRFAGIKHSGAPTLHYFHHGQLWSRYPAGSGNLQLEKGTSFRQRNAYLVAPYPQEDAAARIETTYRRLLHALEVRPISPPAVGDAKPTGALAQRGETRQTAPLKAAIWEALRDVKDEQLYNVDANVVDMGYVCDVSVQGETVEVLVTMPHRGRPVYQFIASLGGGRISEGIRERLLHLDGIRDVIVRPTWNPPWTVARMTEAGRRTLGLED